MAFKDRLKEVRMLRGLKQKELAEKIGGITGNTISNYEKGVSSPSVDIMKKIFDILEVTPNYMFQDSFNSSYNEKLDMIEISLIKKYRALDKISKDIVNYIVNAEFGRANNSSHIISAAARGNSHIEIEVDDNKLDELVSNYKPPEDL